MDEYQPCAKLKDDVPCACADCPAWICSLFIVDRLRQKYEAWSKQFKQRMREAQTALRRKQGGSGPLPYSNSSLQNAHSIDSQDLGVPGVHSMVGHAANDMVAVPKAPQPHQQHRPQHTVHAHAAQPAGPDAAVTVAAPAKAYKTAQVDVRKMPDLNAPDLLGGGRSSDGGSDGGKKKKGLMSRVFG
jgi:hypothetical protein